MAFAASVELSFLLSGQVMGRDASGGLTPVGLLVQHHAYQGTDEAVLGMLFPCSLVEAFWGMYQHDTDREVIGRFALDHLAAQVERGLELRRNLPPSSIVDVPYHKLSADPFAEVPRRLS